MRPVLLLLAAPLVLVLVMGYAVEGRAAGFTVSSADDAGAGTLRQAIEQANANPGPDRIEFNVPGVGAHSIHLLTPLPEIVDRVAIDATTQPGYFSAPSIAGTPLIEIEGSGVVGASSAALRIGPLADGSSIRGLAINRFDSPGILINFADACTVAANHIGVDVTGKTALPNDGDGVIAYGFNHVIGGLNAKSRNVISGNAANGITMGGGESASFDILGNYIGTDADGRFEIGNSYDGIALLTSGDVGGPTLGERNLISGNGQHGVAIYDDAAGNGVEILNNYIGTDENGEVAIPNFQNGVHVLAGTLHVIGASKMGNTISGNGGRGIHVEAPGRASLRANRIGTTFDGTRPLGNGQEGVYLFGTNCSVGGSRIDNSGNVIAANNHIGLHVVNTPIGQFTAIQANAIGTNFSGATRLGNASAGIWVEGGNTIIGGQSYEVNTIAYNGFSGIVVASDQDTRLSGNTIFENAWLGVDLLDPVGGPVTPNDNLDLDNGPNTYQNFPMVTAANYVSGQVQAQTFLHSTPNRQFRIDYFANRACDPSGYGEGEQWLGNATVTTDISGNGFVLFTSPVVEIVGPVITATATTAWPSFPEECTSEFSACFTMFIQTDALEASAARFSLGAAFPHPARGSARIPFTLAAASHVLLRVYDVSGREVAAVLDEERSAGRHDAEWVAHGMKAGVYVLRFEATPVDGSAPPFVAGGRVVLID